MDRKVREAFSVLRLEQTKDISKIRETYREFLKQVNPEDDPEGFKRLRAAYEAAVLYAGTPDEEPAETGARPEIDGDSPMGRFLAGFEEIYASMPRRLDPKEWERLLEDPVLLSLEDGERAKWELFGRLLDKFHLPVKIWRVLDKAFFIEGNRREFEEHLPVGFVDFMVDRIGDENGDWDFWYEELTGAEDADYDSFIEGFIDYREQLKENRLENPGERRERLEQLVSYGIGYPLLDLEWLELRLCEMEEEAKAGGKDRREKDARRAEEIRDGFRKLAAEHPDRELILIRCADALYKLRQKKEAAELYQACLDKEEPIYRFWALFGLAKIRADQRDWKEAGRLAKDVYDIGTTDEFLSFYRKVLLRAIKAYEKDADNLTPEQVKDLGWNYIHAQKAAEGLAFFSAHPEYCEDAVWWHKIAATLHLMKEEYAETVAEARKVRECLDQEGGQGEDGAGEQEGGQGEDGAGEQEGGQGEDGAGEQEGQKKDKHRELAAAYEMEGAGWMKQYLLRQEKEGAEEEGAYREGAEELTELFAMAKTCLDQALELAPENVSFLMNKLILLRAAKDYQAVVDVCERIKELDGNHYWAHFYLVEAYAELHMAQEVIDTFYQVIRIYNGAPEVYEYAAEVFIAYRQYEDAQGILRQAKEAGAESWRLTVQGLEVEESLAKTAEEQRAAREHVREVVLRMRKERAPKDLLAKALMEGYYLCERESARDGECRAAALKYLMDSQRLADDVAKLYYIGRMYRIHFKENKKAEHYLRLCEERGMDFEWVYLYLGMIRDDAGKKEEAIAYYRKAAEHHPESKEAYWRIGWVYLRRFNGLYQPEDGKRALEYFLLQDEKGGVKTWNYWRKAKIRYYMEEYEAALEDVEKSFDPDGDSGQWALKADIQRSLGRYDEAIESYRNSIHAEDRHNEDDEYCAKRILKCYIRKKDHQGCIDCLEQLAGEPAEEEKRKIYYAVLALAEAEWGNIDRAMYWLEKKYGSCDVTKRYCGALSEEADRVGDIYEIWRLYLPVEEGRGRIEKNLARTAKWIQRVVEQEKEPLEDRMALQKELADIYFYTAEFESAARHYERIYELTRKSKDYEDAEDLAENMMITYWYLGDRTRAGRFARAARRFQDKEYQELVEQGFSVRELLERQTTGARTNLYKYFQYAYYSGRTQEAYSYLELMQQKCMCYWCGEEGCTELKEMQALLAYREGDERKARTLCEEANRVIWMGNNSTVQQLLNWLDKKNR